MNLFQIAERIKGLPLEAVMNYANGMNPEVPPFVALSELERRNRASKEAQAQQPVEEGTVKDQVEQELSSMTMPQPQGQPQPQMPPQGQPQGGMPPQGLQQLLAMAAKAQGQGQGQRPAPNPMGGVASAPVPTKMFSAGGGIVAFADGSDEEGVVEPVDGGGGGGEDFDAEVEAAKLLRLGKARLEQKPEASLSPLAQRAELIKKYPHLAVLDQPIGDEATKGLRALQAKQAEEDERQREALKDQRKMDFFRSLIAAGEATRGQKGIGALFGGFGKSMLGAEEALSKQEADIRGRGIRREAEALQLQNEIEKLRRARAEGDVQGEIKHAQQVAELSNKLGVSQNALLRGMFQGVASLQGREVAADAARDVARTRAAATGAGAGKTTDFREEVRILKEGYMRKENMPEAEAEERAVREVRSRQTAAANLRASTADIDRATKEARRRALLSNAKLGTAEYDQKFAEFFQEEISRAQGVRAPSSPSAAPAPTATQTSATPPANLLKKGVETKFKNGQVWTLGDDGQPKRVQ